MEGFSFLVSPQDARLLDPRRALRVDYSDDGWGTGFYITTTHAARCELPR